MSTAISAAEILSEWEYLSQDAQELIVTAMAHDDSVGAFFEVYDWETDFIQEAHEWVEQYQATSDSLAAVAELISDHLWDGIWTEMDEAE